MPENTRKSEIVGTPVLEIIELGSIDGTGKCLEIWAERSCPGGSSSRIARDHRTMDIELLGAC